MTDEELVELERRFWYAAGDVDFYRAHVTDDLIMAFPAPTGILEHDEILEAVASVTPWEDVVLEEVHVTRPGPATAIVAYRASARRDDTYRCYAASVYVQDGAAWKLAFHQQTPSADDR